MRCTDEPPSYRLEPDLFASIYTEAIIQTLNPTEKDSLSHLDTALLKYEVTRETFDQNIEFYRSDPELWSDLFTKIVAELEARKPEKDIPWLVVSFSGRLFHNCTSVSKPCTHFLIQHLGSPTLSY